MILSGTEVRAAYYATAELVRRRRRTGEPIPDVVRRFFDRLDGIVREEGDAAAAPEQFASRAGDGIGAEEAAAILGVSGRRVRRIATDLDGTRIGAVWVFSRATVEEYAAARRQR
jgi:hypothetical protein